MYKTIEDFKKYCTMFTDVEKEEIIQEGIEIGNVIDYINFEIESIKEVNRIFNNQKSLVYDIEY